jgi:hypothetical protein
MLVEEPDGNYSVAHNDRLVRNLDPERGAWIGTILTFAGSRGFSFSSHTPNLSAIRAVRAGPAEHERGESGPAGIAAMVKPPAKEQSRPNNDATAGGNRR